MSIYLHVHSNYSFGRGASSIEEICLKAVKRGIRAISITDTNGLYGVIQFVETAHNCGLKPIVGSEVEDSSGNRAILLAENRSGYGKICSILSARHTNPSFSLPSALASSGMDGLLVLTDDIPMLSFLLTATAGKKENMYVEIPPSPPLCGVSISPSGYTRSKLLTFAQKTGFKIAASHPVCFIGSEDFHLACVLKGIFSNSTYFKCLRKRDDRELTPDSWLWDAGVFRKRFEDIPDALKNLEEISRRCSFIPVSAEPLLPGYPESKGIMESKMILRSRCLDGLKWRFGNHPAVKIINRLEYELGVIEKMNLADYFLIVSDIARFARNNYIPMCGRGSAAGSLVAYLLGITDLDPVAHNLYFERFLHEGRKDLPDIDMDFAWNRRDEVIDFVYRRFGQDKVAAISTHVKFAARGALREVARAFGVPDGDVSTALKHVPYDMPPRFLEGSKNKYFLPEGEPWDTIIRIAKKLDGFPKHLGIHVGGMVICPEPLYNYLPVEPASKGIIVTQWEMTAVQKAGLLKIDILGNRSLSVINDVLNELSIRQEKKPFLNFNLMTLMDSAGKVKLSCGDRFEKDERVKELMRTGNTFGCFYIESPAMRGLLRKLRCDTFAGLVAASSVIRPGVSSSGMMRKYIECVRKKSFAPVHHLLKELLPETFGIMVYQEDVMRVVCDIGGLSHQEADLLRRTLSGKRGGIEISHLKDKFIAGGMRRGISLREAEEIWKQVSSFYGYSFCKAHSAAFAEVSMRALYLRAHYPAEFMAAVLSNHGGFYSTSAYISECRRMGLEILPPSVNRSMVNFTAEGNGVRVGLGQIAKLSQKNAHSIIRERELNGEFGSLENFIVRMKNHLGRDELETLVMAGALDEFSEGLNRFALLWKAIFLSNRSGSFKVPPLPVFKWNHLLKMLMEIKTIGFPVSCHPMKIFRSLIERSGQIDLKSIINASQMGSMEGKKVKIAGIVVTVKPIRTRDGKGMAFLSMEDETDLFDVILFPSAYAKARIALERFSGPFLVTGGVVNDFDYFSIEADEIQPIFLSHLERSTYPVLPSFYTGAKIE